MRSIIISSFLLFLSIPTTAGNETRYAAADRHALNAPSSASKSIEALSSYLTKPFSTDEEKARAIYRWIAENISYDVDGYFSGNTNADCDNVLQSRSSVCGGYSNLFSALCRNAGIEVVTIGGYGKGFEYQAGDKVTGEQNHAWNAIKIRGDWKLVDCTWGSGKVDGKHNYIKEFEPYFFMTKPEEFIYRHFPLQKKWQLLQNPVSIQEFQNFPLASPAFFECGLKFANKHSNIIDIAGEYILELSAPEDVLVTSTLEQNKKTMEDAVFIQRSESVIKVRVIPPNEGEYYLHIFAKRGKEAEKVPLAISFKIISHSGSAKNNAFPQIFKTYIETNAQLKEPLTKELPSGSKQNFSLTSLGADKVAVVNGDELDFLKKTGDRFEGNVEIGTGKVSVIALYPGKKDYEVLLEYTGTGAIQRAPGPVKYEKFIISGAELFCPQKKELPAGTVQTFRIKLPGAKKAAVVIDDKWNFLDKNGDYFEGKVEVSCGKIMVVGAYTDTKSFDGLLEYEGR